MGGDNGPRVVVPAALETLSDHPHLRLILVGNQDLIKQYLVTHRGLDHPRLSIRAASQVVEMDEPPALAMRRKRDSSMRVAINLVKEGEADACVSAGNTGALMGIARYVLKTLPGVDRPAIIYSLPTLTGHAHVLDLGANVDCSAEDLFQFAVMGSVLASAVDNNPRPKVALLNIGSESIKGSEQVKRAAELIIKRQSDVNNPNNLNYIGFVEGDDIYKGTADVIVCDGFVGNVALKTSEGLAKMVLTVAKQEFKRHWYARFAAFVGLPVLRSLIKRFDPARYNGASFLGLQGIVIKSHGNAEQKAFATAIRMAMIEVEKNVPEKVRARVEEQLGHKQVVPA